MFKNYILAYGTLQTKYNRIGEVVSRHNNYGVKIKSLGYLPFSGRLYQDSWFPKLVKTDSDDTVNVELVELSSDKEYPLKLAIGNLDLFEGSPDFFCREVTEVSLNGSVFFPSVYYWPRECHEAYRVTEFVPS